RSHRRGDLGRRRHRSGRSRPRPAELRDVALHLGPRGRARLGLEVAAVVLERLVVLTQLSMRLGDVEQEPWQGLVAVAFFELRSSGLELAELEVGLAELE